MLTTIKDKLKDTLIMVLREIFYKKVIRKNAKKTAHPQV